MAGAALAAAACTSGSDDSSETAKPVVAVQEAATSSGLPWPSGVHSANELDENERFGEWRGRSLDAAHTFTTRTKGWDALVEPRDFLEGLGWKDFDGLLVISQPMYPEGQGNNAACASGEYDSQWERFGSYLQSIGRADARTIVRIGWEFNGDFMYWHTDADPTNFKECWRRVALSIKATAPDVLTDWTLNGHGGPVPAGGDMYTAYPGDDVVDIVGMDPYDMHAGSDASSSTTAEHFAAQCDAPGGAGLCDLARFAREHGKKLSVGEWGVLGTCGGATRGGNAVADNAVYIQQMAELFFENRDILAYETYYDDPVDGNVCSSLYRENADGSTNSNAAAEYLKWFGPDSPYAGAEPLESSDDAADNEAVVESLDDAADDAATVDDAADDDATVEVSAEEPTGEPAASSAESASGADPCAASGAGGGGSGGGGSGGLPSYGTLPDGSDAAVLRMDVGSTEDVHDLFGKLWQKDQYFVGGSAESVDRSVEATDFDHLYQDQRRGASGYNIPVPQGEDYLLTLHFADVSDSCSSSDRPVFSVEVEGQSVLVDYDVVAAAGGPDRAVVELVDVDASDGSIDIVFTPGDASQLAALEVLRVGSEARDT